jgi:hypothetical protein
MSAASAGEGRRLRALVAPHLLPGEAVLAVGFGEVGPGGALCGLLVGLLERLSLVTAWRLVFTDRRVIALRAWNRSAGGGRGVYSFTYSGIHDLRLARGRLRGRLAFTAAGRRWSFVLPRLANDVSAIADALQGGGALLQAV